MALTTRFKEISNPELPNAYIFPNCNGNESDEDELSIDALYVAYTSSLFKVE